jgi:hypothetical protein
MTSGYRNLCRDENQDRGKHLDDLPAIGLHESEEPPHDPRVEGRENLLA